MGRKGRSLLLAALALLFALFPAGVLAVGIGVFPVQIDLKDALRGSQYERTLTIVNQEDRDLEFSFTMDGEVGKWAAIYDPANPSVPIDKVAAPAQSEVRMPLKFSVPQDAPNGGHSGSIRIMGRGAANPEKGQTAVSAGVVAEVKVDVTGTQKLAGAVLDQSVDEAEVDQPPLRIRTFFQNEGNVKATPIIKLQVKNDKGTVVGEASFDKTTVEPGVAERIVSEWDHSGKPAGKYVAATTVMLGDEKIDEREVKFDIQPRGALTRLGVLDDLRLESPAQVGALAKVVGFFRNTGKIDTKAVLTAEVYRGSALTKVVESRERVVPVGELAILDLFVEVPEAGNYSVRGKVTYEGKVTETKDLSFAVGLPGQQQQPGRTVEAWNLDPWPFVAGAAAALVVALVAGWAIRRKVKVHPSPEVSRTR